jgi:hypothetical protein
MNSMNHSQEVSNQIKAAMLLAGFSTVKAFAEFLRERRDTVSAVMNQLRVNKRVQGKIENKLNIRFEDFKVAATSQIKGKKRRRTA